MPRHAPELECSAEDKASLVAITKSRNEEARVVERARIILACLDGKEVQQVARELAVSIPTVTKWRRRFALWGLRGLGDQPRSGKPVRYDTAFRNRVLAVLEEPPPPGMSHWDGRLWRKSSTPAFMPSGVSYAAKESICKGGAVGV